MKDEPLVDCEECGAAELQKLVSLAAFRLKGTGWYETDFKNVSRGKSDSDASAENGKGEERTARETGLESETKDSSKESKADSSSTSSKSENKATSNAN